MFAFNEAAVNVNTISVHQMDEGIERPGEAGRTVFCNHRTLQSYNDTIKTLRRNAILIPVYVFEHGNFALSAVEVSEFNEDTEARKVAMQMIEVDMGVRHIDFVDNPQAVFDAARNGNPYCKWDSGLAGFMVFDRNELRRHKSIAGLVAVANDELSFIERNLNGEWFEYRIENADGELIDGCSGYHSEEEAMEEARQAA